MFCSLELQLRLCGIGAGSDLEVVFELALVSVEDEVDAGVDIVVAHMRKLGHIIAPARRIVSQYVVALAREGTGRNRGHRGASPNEVHLQGFGGVGLGGMKGEGRSLGTKKKGIAGSTSDETRPVIGGVEIGLSLVGLEP